MGKLGDIPVYNARNPQMQVSSSRAGWVWCVLLLLTRVLCASDWRDPEARLAGKIAAITGPGVVALEISNRSSISSADVDDIRRQLTSSLATAGIRVWQQDQAAATVAVTFSENLQNYVWVAEIQQGATERVVAMVSVARPESAINPQNAPPVTLHASPLVSQPEPILDVAVLEGNPRRSLVLGPSAVAVYDYRDGHWTLGQSLPIGYRNVFPRDLRGRIVLSKDHLFDVYLPGLVCHSTNSSPLAIACSPSDDPWPLQTPEFGLSAFFSPARNFFTGAIVPGIGKQKSAPPFYSAAAIPRANYTLWVLSGADNGVHLLDGINQQTLGKVHWGSDLAGVRTPCRSGGWAVLASSAENDSADSLQAFEFPDREPLAVSEKLNLNGQLSALWTATDGNSAIAVYRNSETGNYEAVQLTLTCGQ